MKGSIRKVPRKSGHAWRVQIYVPGGADGQKERKTKTFPTKSEAEQWKAKMNYLYYEEDMSEPSDQPLSRFLNDWLESHAEMNLAESTHQIYQRMIETHINPVLGDIPLKTLNPGHLQDFYTQKLKDGKLNGEGGLAKSTVNKMHVILHRALKNAARYDFIKRNPARLVDAPTPEDKERPTLTRSQVQTFLDVADEHSPYGPIFRTALYLGLRRSELLGLEWEHVDFEENKISIHQTMVKTTNGDIVFGEPKSESSRRTLLCPPDLIGRLKKHRAKQKRHIKDLGPAWDDERDLVFTSNVGTFIHPRNLRRTFNQILDRADLPRIPFHSLRHSAATLLLERGEHPKVVQSILGHSSIDVTMDVYSHVSDDLQRRATQGLADDLNSEGNHRADTG